MRRSALITGLAVLLTMLAGVASARTGRTYYLDFFTGRPTYKPRLIVLGTHPEIRPIGWRRWRPSFADGGGTLDYADHASHFTRPVRVHLYRPRTCRSGVRIFTGRRIVAVRARDRKLLRFVTQLPYTDGSCANLRR